MRVVYLDEVFFVNFVADYLLLLATAKISGVTAKRWRIALAALFGGAYSAAAVLGGFSFFTTAAYKMASGILMALIVFGGKARFIRVLLVFFAVSAAFAGAVMGASLLGGAPYGGNLEPVTFPVFAISFAVCWAIFSVVFKRVAKHRVEGSVCSMEVGLGGKKAAFSALADTGNSLTDPMTGESVTVCSVKDVAALFDGGPLAVLKDLDVLKEAEAFRKLGGTGGKAPFFLIPYKSVGKSNGLLLAFRPDTIMKNGKKMRGGLIALTPEGVTEGKGYSAITSAD